MLVLFFINWLQSGLKISWPYTGLTPRSKKCDCVHFKLVLLASNKVCIVVQHG